MAKTNIVSLTTVAPKKRKQVSYLNATITQLAKAKKLHDYIGFADCKTLKEAMNLIKENGQDKFDRWGRPTIETKQKRTEELLKLNLPQNANLNEFLNAKFNAFSKNIIKTIKDIDKNFNGSYSPPRQS